MTQLRPDAAYIRTERRRGNSTTLTAFDEEVCGVLSTPHTVLSATKTLAQTGKQDADLESRVADAMLHLLQAERIELSPDS
jgi:hypothetical protein